MRAADFALDYKFDPGSSNDGVTMTVPISLLNQVDAMACEWLVAGFLQDKAEALLKSLPQRHRRHMVPVKHFAQDFCTDLYRRRADALEAGKLDPVRGKGLVEALIDYCRERLQIRLLPADFKLETLQAHLLMNFKLVDEDGRYLAESRMLAQLKADFGSFAQNSLQLAQRLGSGPTRAPGRKKLPTAGHLRPAPQEARAGKDTRNRGCEARFRRRAMRHDLAVQIQPPYPPGNATRAGALACFRN